ncbi:MAG: VWA domain-containing protein [Planctomycetes bacterium]|nr:VWA domain-containing protein [Planctomycetota bacterium]
MPYTAEISRTSPSCFLFIVDQSTSMSEEVASGKGTKQKAAGVADSINHWLQELSIKCAKSDGVRDYFHVGVIGYGRKVGPAFVGSIAGREMVPISEIADSPTKIEEKITTVPDGAGGLVEQKVKIPVWFQPTADGGTPMCRATMEAQRILDDWVGQNPAGFPPIVIHITDGEATDGEPTERIRSLTNLATSDGNVLLFNIHLSANPDATPVSFPDSANDLPDEYSKMLFETASLLTPTMRALAKEYGFKTTDKSRGFVLNADMGLLAQAIDIGTRPGNLK